jgi:nicotinamidase-related amidase
MPALAADRSLLLVIDFQARLMPAIADGAGAVANARRLLDAARLLNVPVLATEQNPRGLGGTLPDLPVAPEELESKMSFDATATPAVLSRLPDTLVPVVAGCEAHVCVLQTVLGLLDRGRRVVVVADAIGSRRSESRETALHRLDRHGAEIVTTEMAIFEWLRSAEHPRFRDALALVR